MSVNYIDKSTGDLIRVAGQGKAEYGASTVRKGRVSTPAISAGGGQSVQVTFTEPMPDNDYEIEYSSNNNPWAGLIFIDEGTKTKNGFNYYIKAPNDESLPAGYLSYTAFKLYTDTEYNNLLNNAVLTSDVTDSVTNGDMNPVTSNAVYDIINTQETATLTFTDAVTGLTPTVERCIKIAPKVYFIQFYIQLSSSYTGANYSMGQFAFPLAKINGAQCYGQLSGKIYVRMYTDATNYVTVTAPAIYYPEQMWAFFGRQSGLAGISSTGKMETCDTYTTRFSGVVFIN